MMTHQECINCGSKYAVDEIVYFCKKCGDLLEVKYDFDELAKKLEKSNWRKVPLSVWRYKDFMPINDVSQDSLLERGRNRTSLMPRLGKQLGISSFT